MSRNYRMGCVGIHIYIRIDQDVCDRRVHMCID